MVFTSKWEFQCYLFPDTAYQEYKKSMSDDQLIELQLNICINEAKKVLKRKSPRIN